MTNSLYKRLNVTKPAVQCVQQNGLGGIAAYNAPMLLMIKRRPFQENRAFAPLLIRCEKYHARHRHEGKPAKCLRGIPI